MTCKRKKMTNFFNLRCWGNHELILLDVTCDAQFQRAIRVIRELFIQLPLVKSNFNLLYKSLYSLVYLSQIPHVMTSKRKPWFWNVSGYANVTYKFSPIKKVLPSQIILQIHFSLLAEFDKVLIRSNFYLYIAISE